MRPRPGTRTDRGHGGHRDRPGPVGGPRAASLLESVLAGEVVAAVPASAYTGASVIDGGTVELGLVPRLRGRLRADDPGRRCRRGVVVAGSRAGIGSRHRRNAIRDRRRYAGRPRLDRGRGRRRSAPARRRCDRQRVLHAALAAYQSGVCRWALDTAVGYAKVRTQFGSAIGSFQAVKHLCADMLCRSEQVTSVAWDLARAVDDALAGGDDALAGGDDATSRLELSVLATDVIVAQSTPGVTKDCIQVLGGIGFTYEHPAHLYLRSALAAAVLLGHAHDQAVALAGAGLAGARRAFDVDLSAVENQRDKVRVASPTSRRCPATNAGTGWPIPGI